MVYQLVKHSEIFIYSYFDIDVLSETETKIIFQNSGSEGDEKHSALWKWQDDYVYLLTLKPHSLVDSAVFQKF